MAPTACFRVAIVVVALIAARPLTQRAVAGSYQKDLPPAADELWSRGLFEEAEALARAVIATRPGDGASRELIARALLSRGDAEGARRECEAALASASVTPKWHYTMGRAYAQLGEFSAAAREFDLFVQTSPPADRGSSALVAAAGDAELFRTMRRSPRAVALEDDRIQRVRFRIAGGHLFVMASINRERPTPWMIDTGAERTAVTLQTAERSGAKVLLQGRGGDERLVALIDEFAFGDLTFHEVPALVRSHAFHTAPQLGGDAFSPLAFGLSMVIDYERAELLLSRRLPDDPHEWTLPMRFHGVPTVRASVGGRPVALVVDSGANATVFAPWAAVDPTDRVLRRQLPMHVVDTRNRRDPGAVMIIPAPSIALGNVALPATPVITMDLERPSQTLGFQIGGLLGHATLQTYRVTFDLARSRLSLSRRSSSI
jgi:predicted aspartyl protease